MWVGKQCLHSNSFGALWPQHVAVGSRKCLRLLGDVIWRWRLMCPSGRAHAITKAPPGGHEPAGWLAARDTLSKPLPIKAELPLRIFALGTTAPLPPPRYATATEDPKLLLDIVTLYLFSSSLPPPPLFVLLPT